MEHLGPPWDPISVLKIRKIRIIERIIIQCKAMGGVIPDIKSWRYMRGYTVVTASARIIL